MKLISMTDFVLDCVNNAPIEEYHQVNETFVSKVVNYANFLKQPLKLEMFVPCDENDNLLSEPQMIERRIGFDELDYEYDTEEVEAYKKAKEKILFEGFEVFDGNSIRCDDIFLDNQDFKKGLNIEMLKNYCSSTIIELTPTAIKQIIN